MTTDYILQGSFGRTPVLDRADDGPSAYFIETYLPGYNPTRTRFAAADFDTAYRVFVLLAGATLDAGYSPEAVQFSCEY